MAEIEIGIGKSGRRGFALDDITVVPTRRTRDPEDIDISWAIEGYRNELPFLASGLDAVVSPDRAVELAVLGGLGVLNLEGLWTRYEDPESCFEQIAAASDADAADVLRRVYDEPVKAELVTERIRQIAGAGVVTCASLTPQRTAEFAKAVVDAELDLLVIQGVVVSAEHVSKTREPLNLKRFIREYDIPVVVGGCTSYHAALHLMRTGAVGVLVGVGSGDASTTASVLGVGAPQATAISDAAAARSRHLEETGVYAQVIADGGMNKSGDLTKAFACGADAVVLGTALAASEGSPGRGYAWGMTAFHPSLPRGSRVAVEPAGSLQEVLVGPAKKSDGRANLFGALRAAMAMCGYQTLREFHKADVIARDR
ncbi:MAG: GuaB3 family IMP dehydrogenase-related protein [Acidimicrobiales bacterium]